MHLFIFLWPVLMLMVMFGVAHCDLNPNPKNKFAMLSERKHVVLECNSTLVYPLTWKIMKPGSSSKFEIYNGYNLFENVDNVGSYCKVANGVPGKCDLNLTVTKEAAQRYICLEPGSLIEASAEVIILESDPECNVTSDSESTNFTCKVFFNGNWAPVMEWKNNISNEVISEGIHTILVPNESLTSRLVVLANQSLDPKMYYTCTTKFRIQEKPSETTADNIPPYYYEWTLPEYITVREAEVRTVKVVLAICIPVLTIAFVSSLAAFLAIKRRKKKIARQKNYSFSYLQSNDYDQPVAFELNSSPFFRPFIFKSLEIAALTMLPSFFDCECSRSSDNCSKEYCC